MSDFDGHVIHLHEGSASLQQFVWKNPTQSAYWMRFVFWDQGVAVTGDCGDLLLNPYGAKDSLGWFKGALDSPRYILSKAPSNMKDGLYRYDQDRAKQAVINVLEHCSESERDGFKDLLTEIEGGDICNEHDFQREFYNVSSNFDLPDPRSLSFSTLTILEGSKAFCRAHDLWMPK
jgi:hypothetical protein